MDTGDYYCGGAVGLLCWRSVGTSFSVNNQSILLHQWYSSNFSDVLCGRLIKSFTLSHELKQSLWILIVWFTQTVDQSDNLNTCHLLQSYKILCLHLHIKVSDLLIFCVVFNTLRCFTIMKNPSRSIKRDKEKVSSLGRKTNQKLTNLNKKLPRYPFA